MAEVLRRVTMSAWAGDVDSGSGRYQGLSHCISVNQSTNLENKMLIGLVLFDSL
ncbi:predicted protein [Pyrenophora tritici-repentis Pt-1C-BFP]|uniref:Uncharacterized protein n=1 Tax=Pyrenophora tritici-repentis (strain Pt-1C-BFP) TaxID=426418 RepID=B2W2J3_PYRTR|nr:uncharacterized protein PTRG_03641 [Pyrenophora tritici-repentis Pt-1C-BFP]EDU46479.1 predicted protein [Pyrenophora tritici-repentis Pt-1C-BFP]